MATTEMAQIEYYIPLVVICNTTFGATGSHSNQAYQLLYVWYVMLYIAATSTRAVYIGMV